MIIGIPQRPGWRAGPVRPDRPLLRSVVSRGPRDPRVTGLRRHARILVTGWVLCVLPLLSVGLAYLLLHLPGINRALWHAGNCRRT